MSELGRIIGQQVADWVAVNQKAIQRRAFLVGRLVVWAGRYKSNQVYAFNDMVMFRSYIALAMEDSPQGLPQPGGAGWTIVANLATGGVDNFPDVVAETALVLNTPVEVISAAVSRWAIKQIQDAVTTVPGLVRWRGWWLSNEVYQDRDLVLYNRSVWLNAGGDGPPSRNGWEWLLSTQSGNAGGVSEPPTPPTSLVFRALAPDGNGVMQLQLVGEGTPAFGHTATIYAQDEATGNYSGFGADKAVWSGGRYIDEDTVSANDGGGTPYTEAPFLQCSPLATNGYLYSCDLSDPSINKVGCTVSSSSDASIVAGQTAYDIIENSESSLHYCYAQVDGMTGSLTGVRHAIVEKGSGRDWIWLYAHDLATAVAWFNINTGTVGTVSGSGSPSADIIDEGNGKYRCILRYTQVGTSDQFGVGLADADNSHTYAGDGTSFAVVHYMGAFNDGTIAKTQGLPPILTEGAPASIDAANAEFDIANHNQDIGAYYLEYTPSNSVDDVESILSVSTGFSLLYRHSTGIIYSYDGNTAVSKSYTKEAGTTVKIALIYSATDNKRRICVDGEWGTEGTYNGAFLNLTKLYLARGDTEVSEYREVRRYDGDTYEDLEDLVDELMAA